MEIYTCAAVEYSNNQYNILDSETHNCYLLCNNSALLNYTTLANNFNEDELMNIHS